jgi:hypothetical protein
MWRLWTRGWGGAEMSAAIDRVLERVRQNRAARDAPAQRATPDAVLAGRASPGALVAGDRAFDTVTGEHVEVVSVGSENVVVPAPERAND